MQNLFHHSKNVLVGLVILLLASTPFVSFAFNEETEGHITTALFGIAQQCNITFSASQAICVRSAVSVALNGCVPESGATVSGIEQCVQQAIHTQGDAVLSSCVPSITDAQKACALGSASAATQTVSDTTQQVIDTFTGGTQPTGTAPPGTGFVPLTSIPGIETVAGSDGIASFLNNLYRIAIGVAAVLAVLQITRAGLMYMTEESISEKKEARHLIVMSILGLVLVLSPAIVFGIIDPRILELSVDVSGLKPAPREGASSGNSTTNTGTDGAGTGGDGTETTEPEDTNSSSEVVTCGPGEVEEFSSTGTTCIEDPGDPEGDAPIINEEILIRLTSEEGESEGIVYVGAYYGQPYNASCTSYEDFIAGNTTSCRGTTPAGNACTIVSTTYYPFDTSLSRSSCNSDPAVYRTGWTVFRDCEDENVPQDLTFTVRAPLCSGYEHFRK